MLDHEPEHSWPPASSLAQAGLVPLAIVFALAVLLITYPPMRGMETDGAETSPLHDSTATAFRYLAVDAFYYLGVAERSADAGMYTFDGEHRTNGFHPLWQFTLTYGFRIFGLVGSQSAQIMFSFGFGILLVALGCGCVAMATWRLTRSVSLSLFILAPGPYYILTRLPGMGLHYGSMWSYINGMESPLTIFFFGLILFMLATRFVSEDAVSRRDAVILGILGAFATLARLDDIFIFLALIAAIVIFAEDRTSVERYVRVGFLLIPPAVLVGAYMLYNLFTMGIPMPISGVAKAGLSFYSNFLDTVQMVVPFDIALTHTENYVDMTWRATQVCLPAALAIAILLANRLSGRKHGAVGLTALTPAARLLHVIGIYIVAKAAYNFLNVKYVHQGHWYFPAAVIYANLVLVLGLHRIWEACRLQGILKDRSAVVPVCLIILILFFTIQFTNLKRTDPYQLDLYALWKAGPRITEKLREKYDGKGIIEFDDGIISYSMNIPAMSGLGFTLDREAFEAKERGELLKVAYERGYHVFVSKQYYSRISPEVSKDPQLLRQHFAAYWPLRNTSLTRAENVSEWDFRIVAVHKSPPLVFIGFSPRVPPEPAPKRRP